MERAAGPPALAVLAARPIRAGIVQHYFPRAGAAEIAIEARLEVGALVHVRGATTDFVARIESLRVGELSRAHVSEGKATLLLPARVRPGDVVFALRDGA